MFQENVKLIAETVDPGRLMTTLQEVTTYHRIQGSPGFRAAAQHTAAKLNRQGIQAEVLSFPASDDAIFDLYPSFQEWNCRAAYCDIVSPFYRRIADFDRDNISVIQKSIGCDYRDRPLEIVMLDKGRDPKAYEGVDLKGKIVFIPDMMNPYYDWAIVEGGAVGILTDHVLEGETRSRYDQLDTLRYTSFWWDKGQTHKAFGCVLTPREGDKLRKAIEEAAAKGETVKVSCYIDAELYDGSIEDVTAFLPGETDEEVLLSAHLCHPRASANDNASGVSAAMEALRVIKELVDAGKLPPLKRGIRMLLIPEFTGTYAYLDRIGEGRRKIMGGFNLDMVGGRQVDGYGPLVITDLPRSTPSIIGDLSVLALEEVKQEVSNFGGGKKMPLFNSAVSTFSGGSDHQVLSDPCVGIPAVMLGQWPDKFYHTSSDTVDMIDPHVLSKSCTLAAAFAYTLATLTVDDAKQVMNQARVRLTADLADLNTARLRGDITEEVFAAKAYGRAQYSVRTTGDYARFFSGEELAAVEVLAEAERGRIADLASAVSGIDMTQAPVSPLTDGDREKYAYVPRRTHATHSDPSQFKGFLTPEQWEGWSAFQKSEAGKKIGWGGAMIMFLVDGKRTAAQIMDELYAINGAVDPAAVDAYLKALVPVGLVTIQ